MANLIDKSALVAMIKSRMATNKHENPLTASAYVEDEDILEAIDTLEVREANLDFQTFAKEMETVFALPSLETENTEEEPLNWEYAIAKHFFELGLRSTITEEDCKLIWNIGDDLPYMSEEEFFKELLRRYKAQKGE